MGVVGYCFPMASKNPPPCQVCGQPSVSKNLCDKHYRRFRRHGDSTATLRPDDWGKRHSHPLWGRWKQTARTLEGRVPLWDDFWKFVEDVGPLQERCLMKRYRADEPWGPDNFYWKQPIVTFKAADDPARYQRELRRRNRIKTKGYGLKKVYGITLDQYHKMLDEQGGVCAICGSPEMLREYLSVDHCHETKKVRGLLCGICNRALGGFRDNVHFLARAIEYLRKY